VSGRPKVLVVEDDPSLLKMVAGDLRLAGYDVFEASTGSDGLEATQRHRPDAVLLDLGLPDLDGLEVAKSIRGESGPAILMVTARGAVEDRVDGLYAGADDYITKPFSLAELRARLHAQLRARRASGEALEFGPLVLEPLTRRCLASGKEVALSAREFELLLVMARRPGRIYSQAELAERTYHEGDEPDSNALEVRVSSIRRKLRDAGLDGLIVTIRGAGYCFRSPVPA
jgi:two-component system response regulator QseB